MNISRKVRQWQAVGLIDEATAARIEAFERSDERPMVLYTVGGLGALTIGIGIISVVAANWEGIGSSVKLAVDLVLAVVLAAATFHMVQRERRWLTEVLVVVYYLFSLASLALVGQIYQSDRPIHEALLVWSAATLPLMLLGRSHFLGLVWCVGVAISEGAAVVAWLDYLGDVIGVDKSILVNLTASIAFVSPLAFVVAGHLPALRVQRAQVGAAFRGLGWSVLLTGGLAVPFAWYLRLDASDERLSWAVAICALSAFAFVAALRWLYPHIRTLVWRALSVFFTLLVGTLAAATTLERAPWPWVGALTQTLMLAVLAFVTIQNGRVYAFNALTALVALRILLMYFEVFGSMLSTGLGMMTGGTLTLLLAWGWWRQSPTLARRIARVEG